MPSKENWPGSRDQLSMLKSCPSGLSKGSLIVMALDRPRMIMRNSSSACRRRMRWICEIKRTNRRAMEQVKRLSMPRICKRAKPIQNLMISTMTECRIWCGASSASMYHATQKNARIALKLYVTPAWLSIRRPKVEPCRCVAIAKHWIQIRLEICNPKF